MPQRAVKGQALTDFLADHPRILTEGDLFEIGYIEITPWKLMFDGYKNERGVGAEIMVVSPEGRMFQFAYQLDETWVVSNNQAKYEALIIGLEIAQDIKIN